MDPSQTIKLVVLIILLILSGFFSSAETALTTVSQIRLLSLSEAGNKRAALTLRVKNNASKMLSAVLIGNNIVNISASSLATTLAIDISGGNSLVGLFTGILTVFILIFGEIIPKTLATMYSEKLSLTFSPVINLLMIVLTPLIYIINLISNSVLTLVGANKNKAQNTYTEDELRTIVSVSHKEGVIESDEKQIINNLFDFGDALAKDVMIPRIDMTSISIDSTYQEIISIFRQEKYTRLPVYEDSNDNVIGIINVKDLLLYDQYENFNVRDILREPYYTYEFKNVSELMDELKKTSNNIVIVLDEYGSTVGMITLEDLLEEIVGEIQDEYDEDEDEDFKKVDNNTYIIDGSTRLDDINDMFGTSLSSEEYESVAGYIIETLDKLPDIGDYIETDTLRIVVKSLDKNRIETVELTLLHKDEEENTENSNEKE